MLEQNCGLQKCKNSIMFFQFFIIYIYIFTCDVLMWNMYDYILTKFVQLLWHNFTQNYVIFMY